MEKLCSWIIDIILIIFATVFLILALNTNKNYIFDTTIIKEYKENWEKGPLLDIVVSSDKCPEGYDYLISNKYPGLIEGCNCTNSTYSKYKNNIFENECDAHKIIEGCKIIFPFDPLTLGSWRNKEKKLCAKRMKKNFWQIPISQNCEKGFKKCGYLDTFNNTICLPNEEICPINDIVILPSETKHTFSNYQNININKDYILYYTNQANENPVIVELVPSLNDICVHPFEGLLGQNNFTLNTLKGPSKCQTKIKKKLTDNRFSVVDTYYAKTFFKDNEIDKLSKSLPQEYFPGNEDYVNLYKINYYGWKKECYSDPQFSTNKILTPQITVDFFASKSRDLYIITIVHIIFALFSIIVLKLVCYRMKWSALTLFLIDVINIIILIVILVLSIVIFKGSNEILETYNSFVTQKCGDDVTNQVIEWAFKYIFRVKAWLFPITIMSSIEICLVLGYHLWHFLTRKEYTYSTID